MTNEDDLDRIMQIMANAFNPAFGEAWTRRQVEDALSIGNCLYLLADECGEQPETGLPAVGFSLSRGGFGEEELLLFAVDPRYRGRGIGKRLLHRFVQNAKVRGAKRLFLEMRKGNPAELLYVACGFSPVGSRPNYYRAADGKKIDAITFVANCE